MYSSLQASQIRKLYAGIASVLTGIALASCASGRSLTATPAYRGTPSPDEIAAYAELADGKTLTYGRQIYTQYCASCHGINGEGQFPDVPDNIDSATGKYGAPPHNETGHTWHHDDDLLLWYIQNGGVGNPDKYLSMPPYAGILKDAEIRAVVAHIKSMWTEEQRYMQAENTLTIRWQNQNR